METIIDTLNKVICEEPYFLDQDKNILIEKVKTSALNLDEKLMKILLNNADLKKTFFVEREGFLIFDKVKFSWIISNSDFLPDSFTSFKNKIGLINEDNDFLKNKDDVTLSFPYKDCVLEFDSTKEDEERNEIFLNEFLAKNQIDSLLSRKAFCNSYIHEKTGNKPILSFSDQNLIIKGNNLITMHSLLDRYAGRVKLMYWDILFNTDNDQVPYNDSFKHSSWLVMMKNRLEIAQQLLKSDGVICLQCDKNEDAYLKVLCDEIFGRDNYVNTVNIKTSTPSGTKTAHKDKTIIKTKDTLLVYKNGDHISINPQYIARDNWDGHFTEWIVKENGKYVRKKVIDELIRLGLAKKGDKVEEIDIADPEIKKFYLKNAHVIGRWTSHKNKEIVEECLKHPGEIMEFFNEDGSSKGIYLDKQMFSSIQDGVHNVLGNKKDEDLWSMLLCDLWTDIDFQNTQNEGNNSLPAGKKPEFLLRRIIEMFTKEGDLVLDAYLGSGTTAAVCMKTNRRFIGIEQLDEHFEKSKIRLDAVINGDRSGISEAIDWNGGGSFISCELAKDNLNIVESITACTSKEQLIEIFNKLRQDARVLNYNIDLQQISALSSDCFDNLSVDEVKQCLISLLEKNILYVSYSDIEDSKISDADKQFTNSFYGEEVK